MAGLLPQKIDLGQTPIQMVAEPLPQKIDLGGTTILSNSTVKDRLCSGKQKVAIIICTLIAAGFIASITSYILNTNRTTGGSDNVMWLASSNDGIEDRPIDQGHLTKRSIDGNRENPDWFVTRDMWKSAEVNNTYTTDTFDPLKLVVIHHTETFPCLTLDACAEAMRRLQNDAQNNKEIDVPYNFVIGNDGRVYEARGWGLEGAQRFDVNRCSLTIAFMGDYHEDLKILTQVTEMQLYRTQMILQEGVELGYLQEDYLVVGAKDLLDTTSPGSNLYNAIQQWEHYDHENRYKDMTCEEIYDIKEEIPCSSWFITRDMWKSAKVNNTYTTETFDPLKLVVIHHTETFPCLTLDACTEAMRRLQSAAINNQEIDVPYNFVIGNDGRVYEARGWGHEGAQRFDVNRCSLTIAFMGDYRKALKILIDVTETQLNRTQTILQEGVELGYLQEDYLVVGAKDLLDTTSPGSNLYNAIQQWEHYDHENRYKDMTCEEIYDIKEEIPEPGWFVTRDMWKSAEIENTHTTETFDPLKLVVIHHTATSECYNFEACADVMRRMQTSAINNQEVDVPYNFMIGNDGRVYEARGWGVEGAQRLDVNRCSLTIGFIGDYREELEIFTEVTDAQLERAKMILQKGVELGYLQKDYLVVGAKDLIDTVSPGSNLYNAIRQWEQYDHENRYRTLSCEQIYDSDWFVPRDVWLSARIEHTLTTAAFDPLKLVVIHHTVTATCFSLDACADAMRRIQTSVINNNQELDIPYNFVIGNDGRVYEARGWGIEGAQRAEVNRCSLTIGFIGNYEQDNVTVEQLNRARRIIQEGVRLGHLVSNYLVVGARDVIATVSPGANLYRAIQQWQEFDHQNRYGGMSCERIYS